MQSAFYICNSFRQRGIFRKSWLRVLSTDRSHLSATSEECVTLEKKHTIFDQAVLPVVLTRGYGARVWDLEGREYLDFLSAHNSVNLGHCHPRLVTALASQAATLSLTSRAFYNDKFGAYLQRVCTTFGYDRCVALTTGDEARDMALKLTQRWAHKNKHLPEDNVVVVIPRGSFWGRAQGAGSFSAAHTKMVDYGDLQQLEEAMSHPHVAAFMVEPIQSEAGVAVPPRGYLPAAADLCKKHNALLIADEIQTGLGRTGRLLCVDHDSVRPDMVMLGRALTSGMYPMSAVLGRNDIVSLLGSGEHPIPFGGDPLGCAVAMEALEVVVDEKLAERAEKLGKQFRKALRKLVNMEFAKDVRGMGLLNALQMPDGLDGNLARHVCVSMAQQGILAKATDDSTIRFSPPLVITEMELTQAAVVIHDAVRAVVSEKRSGPLRAKLDKVQ